MSDLKLVFVKFTGLSDFLVGHIFPPLRCLPMFCTPTRCISQESHTCESHTGVTFLKKSQIAPDTGTLQGENISTSLCVVWLFLFICFGFFTSSFQNCKGQKWNDGGINVTGVREPRKRRKNHRRNEEMGERHNTCQLCRASKNVQFSQDRFSKC